MAHALGVDEDDGSRVCHGRWASGLGNARRIYLTDSNTRVLCEKDGVPQMTMHGFGKGVYMSHFTVNHASTCMLLETLLPVRGLPADSAWLSDSAMVETAYYPQDRMLAALNNAEAETTATLYTNEGKRKVTLKSLETRMILLLLSGSRIRFCSSSGNRLFF